METLQNPTTLMVDMCSILFLGYYKEILVCLDGLWRIMTYYLEYDGAWWIHKEFINNDTCIYYYINILVKLGSVWFSSYCPWDAGKISCIMCIRPSSDFTCLGSSSASSSWVIGTWQLRSQQDWLLMQRKPRWLHRHTARRLGRLPPIGNEEQTQKLKSGRPPRLRTWQMASSAQTQLIPHVPFKHI